LEARAPRLSPLPRLHCPDSTAQTRPPWWLPCIVLGLPSQYPPSTFRVRFQVDPLHPPGLGRRRRVLEPLQRAPAGRGQCALALHLNTSAATHPRSGCRVPSLLRSCGLDSRSTLRLRAFAILPRLYGRPRRRRESQTSESSCYI
jgi:hypothetical protein